MAVFAVGMSRRIMTLAYNPNLEAEQGAAGGSWRKLLEAVSSQGSFSAIELQ